jgi:hypothetical protein
MHWIVPPPHRVVHLGPLVPEIDAGRKPMRVVLVDRDDDLRESDGFLGSRLIDVHRDSASTGLGLGSRV